MSATSLSLWISHISPTLDCPHHRRFLISHLTTDAGHFSDASSNRRSAEGRLHLLSNRSNRSWLHTLDPICAKFHFLGIEFDQ
ncbi:hypothetical protein L2E82_16265 [Cichorium intybus]|uniref:Uncharacterized protein n=1 Tax=Cichorium intybus TaxID=13427 RepID=A0ACB9F5N6_CICIN|nr:hypothetical protein L2E82_16265 [Cichorium intybus]